MRHCHLFHQTWGWIVLVAVAFIGGCASGPRSQVSAAAGDDWIETELFFGLTENGTAIPRDQWQDFVDRSVTSRFPDGFSIVYAYGQYRGESGKIERIPSAILILLHKTGDEARDDAALNAIAEEYNSRFHQESVLRSDWPARANFITGKP